ncbi:MAG: hypothetical protein AAB465_02665 [Patescibacteria group bacterium]
MENKEYNILNILRGTSALLVLFYHFFVFFFAHQKTWTPLLQVVPLDLPQPFYLQALLDFPLDFGHLAVGYFFLIPRVVGAVAGTRNQVMNGQFVRVAGLCGKARIFVYPLDGRRFFASMPYDDSYFVCRRNPRNSEPIGHPFFR